MQLKLQLGPVRPQKRSRASLGLQPTKALIKGAEARGFEPRMDGKPKPH